MQTSQLRANTGGSDRNSIYFDLLNGDVVRVIQKIITTEESQTNLLEQEQTYIFIFFLFSENHFAGSGDNSADKKPKNKHR